MCFYLYVSVFVYIHEKRYYRFLENISEFEWTTMILGKIVFRIILTCWRVLASKIDSVCIDAVCSD